MTPAPAGRRVLVALDASLPSLEALSAAAALAARIGAQLEGLFVEDVNVLRAAGLPLATQLSAPSGRRSPLDRRSVEVELGALARAASEALARVAGEVQVRWSFRIARGLVATEVIQAAAAEGVSVLVLGRTGHGGGPGPGAIARAAASRAAIPVLLVGRSGGGRAQVFVVYDGTPESARALDAAAQLDGRAGALVVVLLARDPRAAARLAERARPELELRGLHPARMVAAWGAAEVSHAARDAGALLVVGGDTGLVAEGGLETLLRELDTPLLVVR